MSGEREMERESPVSRSVNALRSSSSSSRRRRSSRRRGRNSITTQARSLNRSSSGVISSPKPAPRNTHLSSQSSTVDLSAMEINDDDEPEPVQLNSTTPPPTTAAVQRSFQATTRTLPFDVPSDDEQHGHPNTGKPTKSGKMSKKDVMSHFTMQSDGRYMCNKCNQVYLAYRQSATNLRKHLLVMHDMVGAAYDSQVAQVKQQSPQPDISLPLLPEDRKKQLDQAIVNCIIDDSLPFTTFKKPGMANLMHTFDSRYKPPSRFTIASRVNDSYHKYINEVKLVLGKAPAVAFTSDIWKGGRRKYFVSLTAHLFNYNFELFPLVLSFRQFTERHLAVNVQSFLMYELDEKFRIPPERRMGITTDCGSEMVAATAGGLFGQRHACIAHVWQNVVKNGLCLWSKPNISKFPIVEMHIDDDEPIPDIFADEDDLGDDEEENSDQFVNEEEEGRNNNDSNTSQSSSIRVTTSNTVVRTKISTNRVQDEYLSGNDDDDQPITIQPDTRALTLVNLLERTFSLLNRCRQLVSDMRNIGIVDVYVSMEIGQNVRGLTLDMEIRWNTTFQMLDRLLQHQTVVDDVVRRKFNGLSAAQANRLKLAALTPDDWDILRALHHVLMGFDTATTIISASYYPTLADSFWAIAKLRKILNTTTNDSRYVDFFKQSALNYLNVYIQKHLSKKQQEGMLIAAFLDPEVHNDMNERDFVQAKGLVKKNIEMMPTATSTNISHPLVASSFSTSISKKENAKQLMNRLAGIRSNLSNTPSFSMSVDVEIAVFMNTNKTNQTFSQFWSANRLSFPRLVALVHRYCLVPATSVSSESAFSIAGFIARKQRASLSSRALRHLLVLKYRKNLVKFQSKEEAQVIVENQSQQLSLDPSRSSSV